MIEYMIGCLSGVIAVKLISYFFPDNGWEEAHRLIEENARLVIQIRQLLVRDGLGSMKMQWSPDVINMMNGGVGPKEDK